MEHPFYAEASWWVALSMLVLIGIAVWRGVPALIGRALDGRIAKVRADLDEAAALRSQAEALLAGARAHSANAGAEAAAIVAAARAEAEAATHAAHEAATRSLTRRTKAAEDKIAAAERDAEHAIRARAADLALAASRTLIASHGDDALQRRLADQAIAELDRRLH